MAANGQPSSRTEADSIAEQLKQKFDFLQWDRDVNGKLYYALWIVFMAGFVLSINSTISFHSPSRCTVWMLHAFRVLAVVGSALNFLLQSTAIDAVRYSHEISVQYERHIKLAGSLPNEASIAYKRAEELKGKLKCIDCVVPWLAGTMLACASAFLLLALYLTWQIIPTH